MKKDKVNNWSQEILIITPYINFEHIKGKENVGANNLSTLGTIDLYEADEPKKEGHEYGKSVFDSETVCSIEIKEKVNQDFEVGGVKYQLDAKQVDDLLLHDTSVNSKNHDPLSVN